MHFLDNLEGNQSKSVQKQVADVSSDKCLLLSNLVSWVNLYIEEGNSFN